MPDIDWSKPVEYVASDGDVGQVIASALDDRGIRHVLVQTFCIDGRANAVLHRTYDQQPSSFRNVRRKVKHKAKYWLIAFETGEFVATHDEKYVKNLPTMQGYRKGCCVVTEHTHEWDGRNHTWEADADE